MLKQTSMLFAWMTGKQGRCKEDSKSHTTAVLQTTLKQYACISLIKVDVVY